MGPPLAPTGYGGLGFMLPRLDFSVVVGHQQRLPLTVVNGGGTPIAIRLTRRQPTPQGKVIVFNKNLFMAKTDGGIACVDTTMASNQARACPICDRPSLAGCEVV
jgi:hypothetical protein